MKQWLPILLCLLLLLSACTQQPAETLTSTELSTGVASTPTTESAIIGESQYNVEFDRTQAVEIGHDPDDGKLVVYMGIGSTDFRFYSIAPAGTEDWVRLDKETMCYNEDVHDYYGMFCFVGETEYEDCTLWDLKAEVLPEEYPEDFAHGPQEYSCELWKGLEIHDGQTRIVWKNSDTPVPEEAVFCLGCLNPRLCEKWWNSAQETESIEIDYDPNDGKIVVYMGIGSPHFRIYSIAPAGTEDWVRLTSDADCYNEDVHSFYGMIRFTAETENEDCTLWDLKAEFIPEEFADVPNLEGDKEYQCEFFEDLEIRDGETRIVWYTDGAAPVSPIPEEAVFCPNCPEMFE